MDIEQRARRFEDLYVGKTADMDSLQKAAIAEVIGQLIHDIRNALATSSIDAHVTRSCLDEAAAATREGDTERAQEELEEAATCVTRMAGGARDASSLLAEVGMLVNRCI